MEIGIFGCSHSFGTGKTLADTLYELNENKTDNPPPPSNETAGEVVEEIVEEEIIEEEIIEDEVNETEVIEEIVF